MPADPDGDEDGGHGPRSPAPRQAGFGAVRSGGEKQVTPASRRLEWVAFALVLALAGALRFTGVNWDNGSQLHPDERFLGMVEGAIRFGVVTPGSNGAGDSTRDAPVWSYYFDSSRSGLNPHNVGYGFFVYGTFPLFAAKLVIEGLKGLGIDNVHLVGRSMSALSDVGSTWLAILIARRLIGTRVALLAGALMATCVLHIQQAHFFVFDSFLVTLVLGTFWYCLDIVAHARWRDFAMVGLVLGLTLATKLSMVVFLPIVAIAGLVHLLVAPTTSARAGGEARLGPTGIARVDAAADRLALAWGDGRFATVVAGGLLVGIVAFATFRVVQPYAFAGPGVLDVRLNPRWLDNIDYQAKSQSGEVDLPPSIQWANTTPVILPLRHMVIWGLGIPLGIASLAGVAAGLWAALVRGNWQVGLLACWAATCLLYFSSVLNKTMRYLLPAYPFAIILAAWLVVGVVGAVIRARSAGDDGDAGHGAATGAGAASWLRGRMQGRALGPLAALGAWAVICVIVAWSSAWSFAFTRIYQRPVSRGTASAWIYRNVPPPAPMANEHWDDPLPLPMPGRDHSRYAGPQLPLYDPDEPRKIDTIVQVLSQSTYLNMTSNRLYGSIPRMPERYPMTTEYYRRLFAGDLGYSHVATITSYPTLGWWTINDDAAEEAFTVYDHPKVLIYKKDADFSPQKVRDVLSAVPLDNVRNVPPIMAGRPTLLLGDEARASVTAGGTWRDAFRLDGPEQQFAPVTWYVAVSAIGFIASPVLWTLLPSLPDRGHSIARTLGLLGVSWVGWWLASIGAMPWTRLTVLVAALIVAVGAGVCVRGRGREWVRWLVENRGVVLGSEATFLLGYAAFCAIRAYNPDLWHPARGGEKPMEFAYLNAVIRTASFPPYDPWYAGGYLNYYYFGYVLVAAVTKLTGIVPAVAFNLAVPTMFALAASGAYGAVANVAWLGAPSAGLRATSRVAIAGGALGATFMVVAGNLDAFGQFAARLARAASTLGASGLGTVTGLVAGVPAVLLAGAPLEGFDFWRSSRVIPNNTINEFPFWTFLFSDLHAHMISLAFQVATLVVLVAVVASAGRAETTGRLSITPAPRASWSRPRLGPLGEVAGIDTLGAGLGLGWLLGALNVINTWEFPTYVGLSLVAVGIREVARARAVNVAGVARAGVTLVVAVVAASALYRPFWTSYLTVYGSVTPWTTDKSRLADYVVIHGAMLFELVAFLAMFGWTTWRRTTPVRWMRVRMRHVGAWPRLSRLETALGRGGFEWGVSSLVTAFCATLAAVAWLAGLGLVGSLVVLAGAMVATAWDRRESGVIAFAAALGATGAAIGVFVEFFALSGDIGRMNTVFKFYLQVWVIWSVVAAAAATWMGARVLASRRGAAPGAWEWGWATGFALLGLAALAYPLGAVPARLADRFAPMPPSLDGMAYMGTATVLDASSEVTPANPGGATIRAYADRAAIDWLLRTVDGTPVVLEASIPEYRWGSRVSKYTGLPAVLGWRWHQAQQRGPYAPQVDARLRDVQTMFNAPQAVSIAPLLARYHVRYVYVGDLERAYYSPAGIAKFGSTPEAFRRVFDREGVEVFEVVGTSAR